MPTLFEAFQNGNAEQNHGGAVMRNYKPGTQDNFQTLPKAVKILFPYISRKWQIWEPACGKGNIVRTIAQHGIYIKGTDINRAYYNEEPITGGLDFLSKKGMMYSGCYDAIITNPPFSLKDDFLERCLEIGKPFALLLPITAMEPTSVVTPGKRIKLLQSIDWEVICPTTRIAFETPSGKPSKPHKGTCWLTHGLNIGRQWTYVDMEKD